MRLLVVTSAPPVKRLPGLFVRLLDGGAELVLDAAAGELPAAVAGHPLARRVALPLERSGAEADAIRLFRALADVTRFLGPELAQASWPRRRALRRVLQLAGHRKSRKLARGADALLLPQEPHDRLARSFRWLERAIPPDPRLVDAVARLDVDAVLLVSRCILGGVEPDVLKAARALGLPSVMLVWSWDNLSSKAVQNEHPDHLLVWNDVQAREATDLHAIPPERVHVVGAANFDPFFEELSAVDSPSGDGRATLLYLGSSPKVVPAEPPVFDRWLAHVRGSGDVRLRDARVVVRPHPAAERKWSGWAPSDPLVEVSRPDAKIEHDTLARLLAASDAVVALNTSAEIEAAIARRPVVTFRAGDDARGQEGSVHFGYLLEEHDGFVADARTLDEHIARLAAAVRGEYDVGAMDRFVERFVRPAGRETPVLPRLAETIVRLAGGPAPPAGGRRPESRAQRRGPRPRVLALSPSGAVGSVPGVFLELLGAGAEVVFSGQFPRGLRLPPELAEHDGVSVIELPLRACPEELELFRALRDALRFRNEALAEASWPRTRATRRFLKLAGHPEKKVVVRLLDGLRLPEAVCARLDDALRAVEQYVAPPEPLERAVRGLAPDVLLLVTRCTLGGSEPDAIKVARRLGIPSVMLVWSWDNLSSKAMLHEHPDHVLVWNELQAREAIDLHGVPGERVRVLGAPNFDRFFAQVEADEGSRSARGRATIVYAGSSKNVAPDEPEILARWLAAVRSADDPLVRDALVRVRPYPGGLPWRRWEPPDDDPLVSVERWDKRERDRLAPLLLEADAVVALNTSAEIEAAIAGRPVVTFRAGADAPGQEGSLHFRYLLDQSGGFVVDAADLGEHVARLAPVLRGEWDAGRLRSFVERFVRPCGIERPVAPVVAATILELAAAPAPEPVPA